MAILNCHIFLVQKTDGKQISCRKLLERSDVETKKLTGFQLFVLNLLVQDPEAAIIAVLANGQRGLLHVGFADQPQTIIKEHGNGFDDVLILCLPVVSPKIVYRCLVSFITVICILPNHVESIK